MTTRVGWKMLYWNKNKKTKVNFSISNKYGQKIIPAWRLDTKQCLVLKQITPITQGIDEFVKLIKSDFLKNNLTLS